MCIKAVRIQYIKKLLYHNLTDCSIANIRFLLDGKVKCSGLGREPSVPHRRAKPAWLAEVLRGA